jgi:hypothetical protein
MNSTTKAVAALADKQFDGIKNKVIMPAGNVFNYAGVDTDSQGNLFTHLAFARGAEDVEKTKGGSATNGPVVASK